MSDMVDSRIAWIQKFTSGKIWFNKLTSLETKRTYLRNLQRYCKAVGKNPDQLIELKMEGQRNIGTMKEFQAETLLETFFASSKLKASAKFSLKTAVLSFYQHNRRELASNTASNIVAPEPKKRCPEMDDIIALENAMTTARDKFLVWFLSTTAFRVGTLGKLIWKDLQETKDSEIPYQLVIESARLKGSGIGRYRGLKQIAFLHNLVVEKLEAYKKELSRKGYVITPESPLFIAYRKSKKTVNLKSQRMEAIFADASLMAWHDLEKKRFSCHDFRDFLQSKLESAGINANIISPFLAHRVKGTDFHYSTHDIDELRGKFKTALSYLLPQSIEKVKAEAETKFSQLETNLNIAKEDLAKLQPLATLFADEKQLNQFVRLLKIANFSAETDVPEIIDNYIRKGAKEEGKTEREFIEEQIDKKINGVIKKYGIDLTKADKKKTKSNQRKQGKANNF